MTFSKLSEANYLEKFYETYYYYKRKVCILQMVVKNFSFSCE